MKKYYNLSIAAKIRTGIIIIAIIAAIIGAVGVYNMQMIHSQYTKMYEDCTVPLDYMEKVAAYFQRTRVNMYRVILSTTEEETRAYTERIASFDEIITSNMIKFENHISAEDEAATFKALKSEFEAYFIIRKKVLDLALSGQTQEAVAYSISDEKPAGTALDEKIDALYAEKLAQASIQQQQNSRKVTISTVVSVVLLIIGAIGSIFIGSIVARIISTKVNEIKDAANHLALGLINVKVNADTSDEIGDLARAFNIMAENIRKQAEVTEIMATGDLTVDIQINSDGDILGVKLTELSEKTSKVISLLDAASEQVNSSAKQIADSSQHLVQGSTQQVITIEEISASIEEIAEKTKDNASKADEANKLANSGKEQADLGNVSMQAMLEAMKEINSASNDIFNIIKVIDDIAFQTNILALNAAVEAARAGVHGKGFAVVAEEVKNLAGKSASAAKDTTEMIKGSISKADKGTKIATETALSLRAITEGVTRTAVLVHEISLASEEQAAGLNEISMGISQVAQVVQNNTAVSEESAAASEELLGQAQVFKELVGRSGDSGSAPKIPRNCYTSVICSVNYNPSADRAEEATPSELKISYKLEFMNKDRDGTPNPSYYLYVGFVDDRVCGYSEDFGGVAISNGNSSMSKNDFLTIIK